MSVEKRPNFNQNQPISTKYSTNLLVHFHRFTALRVPSSPCPLVPYFLFPRFSPPRAAPVSHRHQKSATESGTERPPHYRAKTFPRAQALRPASTAYASNTQTGS